MVKSEPHVALSTLSQHLPDLLRYRVKVHRTCAWLHHKFAMSLKVVKEAQ